MSTGTEKMNAANELRSFANRFRNVLAAADDLEKLGSIENAETEANARLSALEKRVEDAKGSVAAAETEAADIRQTAETDAALTRSDAQGVLDRANAEAAGIVDKAKADAADIATKAAERKRVLGFEIADLEGQRDRTKVETAEGQARLDELNAELDKIRRKVG